MPPELYVENVTIAFPASTRDKGQKASASSQAALAAVAQYVPNPSGDLLDTVTRLQDSMMAFTAAYLNLEDAENNENNQFTTVSNVLKTKHDTVKNSIGNVR